MGRLLNFWATIYRNTRALGAAVVIWLMVAVMWGLKCQADRDPIVERGRETGTVVEVLGSGTDATDSGPKFRQAVIMLADSTLIQLVFTHPVPEAGDGIPLQVEKYRSGKKAYSFDAVEWKLTGPR